MIFDPETCADNFVDKPEAEQPRLARVSSPVRRRCHVALRHPGFHTATVVEVSPGAVQGHPRTVAFPSVLLCSLLAQIDGNPSDRTVVRLLGCVKTPAHMPLWYSVAGS